MIKTEKGEYKAVGSFFELCADTGVVLLVFKKACAEAGENFEIKVKELIDSAKKYDLTKERK